MKRPLLVVSLVLAFSSLGFLGWLFAPLLLPRKPPTISRETTLVIEPVREDGTIDYAAAINTQLGKGIGPDQNAAVLIQEALGPLGFPPAFYDALQMAGEPAMGPFLTGLSGKHTSPDRREAVFAKQSEAMLKPWSRKEWPELVKWIDDNEAPLKRIHQAVECDSYYLPMVWSEQQGDHKFLVGILNPTASRVRAAGRLLCARAMLRIDEGDLDAAWSDLIACRRMGRLVSQGPTLIDSLVGYSTESMSTRGIVTLLETTNPSSESIKKYQADLAKLPPIHKVGDTIDLAERYNYLDAVLSIAAKGSAAKQALGVDLGVNSSISRYIDWDEVLREANSFYDALVASTKQPTYAKRKEAAEQVFSGLTDIKSIPRPAMWKSRPENGRAFATLLLALMAPAISRSQKFEDEVRQDAANLDVALALQAFRNQNDQFPGQLDEIVPDFLASVPSDVFTGKPLLYRRTEAGYMLYSAGPNMKDDKGVRAGRVVKDDQPDDVVIEMDGKVDPPLR